MLITTIFAWLSHFLTKIVLKFVLSFSKSSAYLPRSPLCFICLVTTSRLNSIKHLRYMPKTRRVSLLKLNLFIIFFYFSAHMTKINPLPQLKMTRAYTWHMPSLLSAFSLASLWSLESVSCTLKSFEFGGLNF